MLRDLSNVEIVALEALEALGGAGSTGEIRAMLRREYRRGLFSTIACSNTKDCSGNTHDRTTC